LANLGHYTIIDKLPHNIMYQSDMLIMYQSDMLTFPIIDFILSTC